MMLPYAFHPIAAVEIEDAVDDYESLQSGKGLELAEQIEAAIKQIQIFPESAPITRGTVRSIVVQPYSRWSYTLHYRIKPTHIRILAIAHQKCQPFYWFGRR